MKNVGGMFHMFFQREPVESLRDVHSRHVQAEKAFYLHALNRGILVPGTQRAFLSAAHDAAVIDRIVEVFQQSLADVSAEGLFS